LFGVLSCQTPFH